MQEIDKAFAKLIGEILAKRWIRQKQKRRRSVHKNATGQEDSSVKHDNIKRHSPTD